jgi:branched-chain amino acid transport system ATP-binding protein
LLSAHGLSAWYGDLPVLRDVGLRVDAGEIVAVVGSNAAGKSTLLAALSGLLTHLGGRFVGDVRVDEQPIESLAAADLVGRGLVHVMEGRRLFPYLTVEENLELGAYHRRARADRRAALAEVFAAMPVLRDRRHQLAASLSGGEQQLCAIGRALMARPRLLMLDEPTTGLAPRFVARTFEILKTLNVARGTTILLVEQNVAHALALADRGYVLENGRVVLVGSGKELLADPRLRAAYLGV